MVTDFNIAVTFQFDLHLKLLGTFGPPGIFSRPQGLSLDPRNGNIIIADSRRNVIRCISPNGTLVDTIQRNKNEYLEMAFFACAVEGTLCIVDRCGMRMRMLS